MPVAGCIPARCRRMMPVNMFVHAAGGYWRNSTAANPDKVDNAYPSCAFIEITGRGKLKLWKGGKPL